MKKVNGVLYLCGKRTTLHTDDGTPFFADIPDKTILIERNLCRDNPKKANHTALHECTHYGLHSLFFLFQASYIEELHQYFDRYGQLQVIFSKNNEPKCLKTCF